MTETEIKAGMEEAARLLNENPSWTYKQAINKAKELMKGENKNR